MPTILFLLELLASLLGVVYIILVARKNVFGWPIGIVSCAIFAGLCFKSDIVSQGIIQVVNVGMGIWGWIQWHKQLIPVKSIPKLRIIFLAAVPLFYIGSLLLFPWLDWSGRLDQIALIFSLMATILTVRMIQQNWVLWLVVNGITAITAFSNELYFYAGLSMVYFGVSLYGIYQWKK
ncbi:MAG: nicotinamide mononucleotide transporter PnuC [Bacteroidota bacterium]|jgi:nicotinamide mononucleotide transporter